jgi:hypothetical protein
MDESLRGDRPVPLRRSILAAGELVRITAHKPRWHLEQTFEGTVIRADSLGVRLFVERAYYGDIPQPDDFCSFPRAVMVFGWAQIAALTVLDQAAA